MKYCMKFRFLMFDKLKYFSIFSFFRSRSYSQFWEDRLISRLILPGVVGSYLDIGSGHPKWGSNTYFFYKRGWTGLAVDPIESNLRLFSRVRPKDSTLKAFIHSSSGIFFTFYEFEKSEYSTGSRKIAEERIQNGKRLKSKTETPSITLGQVYSYFQPKSFVLLNIDIEGFDLEAIKGNDWDNFKPDLICIEELESPLNQSKIREYLKMQGYQLLVFNGVSSIYGRPSSPYLDPTLF